MKQVMQNLGTGATELTVAPCPRPSAGHLLIRTSRSLISPGTERMLVEFGKASLINKALQQPDKVRMVLDKIRTDGLATTVGAVRSKLQQPLALGYCNAGVVIELGPGVTGFREGDRVVSNGPHADVVNVAQNLCAKVPSEVGDDAAAFTVIASIALQGIRLAQPSLGESFVVTGAGLVGLLAVQLLRAQGCRVLAIDPDESKLQLARQVGASICNLSRGEDPVAAGMAFSGGRGVDGVLICASTKSSEPVAQAAGMCRKRGRIVLVGVTGLELNRSDFYQKELTFQVSCSYGPGRYDPSYEEQGRDYPFAFVRWTEQRNFEAVLDLMSSGQLNVQPLISRRFPFENAPEAYKVLSEDRSALGVLLTYPQSADGWNDREVALDPGGKIEPALPVVALIGAGNYASRVLIPALKETRAQLHTIVTAGGVNGVIHGKPAGFAIASTDVEATLAHPAISTVAIATRHDSHARMVAAALRAGKNVFVEKPLAINRQELAEVEQAFQSMVREGGSQRLMVGYNRRFAPQTVRMRSLLASVGEPKSFIMTMNAGAIPRDHWTQVAEVGGGRIIGEACHYIDLMRFLAASPIVSVQARRIGQHPSLAVSEDKAAITLGFSDGSFGTIHYLANGSASFPKERVEVFAAGRVLQLDNFRKLKGFGWPAFSRMNLWRQDKGQAACVRAFVDAIADGRPSPIPAQEIFEVARVTIEAAEILRGQ